MGKIVTEIILASGSPFRRKLLSSTGLKFRVETSLVDEDKILAADPSSLALARALAKSAGVSARFPGALTIGADQVLGMDGQAYGKAVDAKQAHQRLRTFSGRTHFLHSAYVLVVTVPGQRDAQILQHRVVDIPMHMRQLGDEEIDAYIATGEWEGCAGCYQAENRGIHLLLPPMGESSAIIGLPLPELLADMRNFGIDGLRNPAGPWNI